MSASTSLHVEMSNKPCSDACQQRHPNIHTYQVSVSAPPDEVQIGHAKLHVFSKAKMSANGPCGMWEECQAFDDMHFAAKLDKIENYLANESFSSEAQAWISESVYIVYIQEVWLEKEWRGRDLGLLVVRKAMEKLRLSAKTVALLEPGPIRETTCTAERAAERLAAHWAKVGFREWSFSDPAWVCVSLEEGYFVSTA